MPVFKASANAMGQGGAALDTAASEIEAAKAQLAAAYAKLQGQWDSSEARARADKEYQAVITWLESSVRWARSGSAITQDVSNMFARVERAGIT